MWPTTELTKLLDIQLPIIQAPMAGGATTVELVANVSNAGGLGSLGAGYMKPEDIRKAIKKIRNLTDKPFAVNLFIPEQHQATAEQNNFMQSLLEKICRPFMPQMNTVQPPYSESFEEQMTVILEEKVPIFSFTFGIPEDKWLKKLKSSGILLIGTATTFTEAYQLQEKNIDVIVAQGVEAGGHRGTFLGKVEDALIGNFALIPQFVDQIKIPVIAAGGIMDARGIVAALMLGAVGVQMGTVFLTCSESAIHEKYKQILLATKQDNTILTRAFSGKFARGIKNKFIEKMLPHEAHILDYPIQNALTRQMRSVAAKENLTDYMSMWAGQAAYLCKEISADQLIKELNKDVITLLKQNKV